MARFSVEDEYIFDEKNKDRPRSIGQINFNKHLDYLRENWFSISNEDIKIIATLAKKYGAF